MAQELNNGNRLYLRINSNNFLARKATDAEIAAAKEGNMGNRVANIVTQTGSYWHYQYGATDFGFITGIGIVDNESKDGQKFKTFFIVLQKEIGSSDSECLQIPLKTSKGGLNPHLKSIAVLLPNLDINTRYSFSPARKPQKSADGKKEYRNYGIFANYYPEGVTDKTEFVRSALSYNSDTNPQGQIPRGKAVEAMGAIEYDFREQDSYLYKVVEENIKRIQELLKASGRTAQSVTGVSQDASKSTPAEGGTTAAKPATNVQAAKPATPPAPVAGDDDDDDDLPF